jgi:DNA mismatch endonuclease (patch repair protein)
MVVRRLVHKLGYRFRLHRKSLPGTPDLVFAPRKAVIFVHGCFWHGHGCVARGNTPKSNTDYWGPKIMRNRQRDEAVQTALAEKGWRSLVIWECETVNESGLVEMVEGFLSEGKK